MEQTFPQQIEELQQKRMALFEKGRKALGEGEITPEARNAANGWVQESIVLGDSIAKLITAKAQQDETSRYLNDPIRSILADPNDAKSNGEFLEERMAKSKSIFFKYIRQPNHTAFKNSLSRDEAELLAADDSMGRETKSMSRLTDPAGGFFVFPEMSTQIITRLRNLTWIREFADVFTIGSAEFNVPVWDRTYTQPAVAEGGTVAEQTGDTAGRKKFIPKKRSTILKITQELLEDSFFDVEAKLIEMVSEQISEIEEPLFIEGGGGSTPTGILNGGIANLDIATATSDAIIPSDIVKVPMQLTAAYRKPGNSSVRWVIPREQLLNIMLFRQNSDGANTGSFLWNPNYQTGQPATLQGFPVSETEFMTDTSSDGDPLLFFGNLKKYMIVDRGEISVQKLIELYAAEEKIGLKFTKRMDAGVVDVLAFVRLNRT